LVLKKINFWIKALSTFFFLGLFPFAPGTIGSLAGLILYFSLVSLPLFLRLSIILFIAIIGWWGANYYEKFVNRKDPSEIIIDEIVGIWVAYLFIPLDLLDLRLVILGFIFYRAMDIFKIFPIKRLEKMPAGIMLDDIMAGIYTNIFLRCFLFLG
jgi:phosphatidylglycerophosphatase A